jgi:hypothetical protein
MHKTCDCSVLSNHTVISGNNSGTSSTEDDVFLRSETWQVCLPVTGIGRTPFSVLLNSIFIEQSLHRTRTSKANHRNTQLAPNSLTVEVRALLDFVQPKKVVCCRRFGTIYRSNLKGSSSQGTDTPYRSFRRYAMIQTKENWNQYVQENVVVLIQTSISLFVYYLWKISLCISFSYDFVKQEIVVENKTAFLYGIANT